MTFERKIVVGLEDIASVSLECNKCKRRITFSPDEKINLPNVCGCGYAWTQADALPLGASNSPFTQILQAIEVLRLLHSKKSYGAKFLLEYTDPR